MTTSYFYYLRRAERLSAPDVSPLLDKTISGPINLQLCQRRTEKYLAGLERNWKSILEKASSIQEIVTLCTFITENAPGITISRSPMHTEWPELQQRANKILGRLESEVQPQ